MTAPVITAFVVSTSFSVLFGVRGRKVWFAGAAGALAYLVSLLAAPLGSLPSFLFYGAAAALASEIFARLLKAPATLFLAAGLIPMVPGGGLYRSVLLALEGSPMESVQILYDTLLQVGAIAVGLILVSSLLKLLPGWGTARPAAPPKAQPPPGGTNEN